MRTKLVLAGLAIAAAAGGATPAAGAGSRKPTRTVRVYEANVLVSASLNWLSSSFTEYACGQGTLKPRLDFHGKGSARIELRAQKVRVKYTYTLTKFRQLFADHRLAPFPLTGTWRRNASYVLQPSGDYAGCPPGTGEIPPPSTSGCGTKEVTARANKVSAQAGPRGKRVRLLVTPVRDLFGSRCPDESTLSAALLLDSDAGGSLDDMRDGEKTVRFSGTEEERLKTGDLAMIGPSGRTGGGQWAVTWSATFKLVK